MKKFDLYSSLVTVLMASLFLANPVQAQEQTIEQTAEQEQEIELECETVTSGYGQTITRCYGRGEQGQVLGQKVVLVDGEPVEKHEMADTALDSKSLFAAISAILTGTGAFIVKLKTKA